MLPGGSGAPLVWPNGNIRNLEPKDRATLENKECGPFLWEHTPTLLA